MLAKLTVGNPWRALLILFERKRINKTGRPSKTDIIGAGVFERHVKFKRAAGNGKRENSRVFVLIKTPFVRIRDEA